jgi:hypothetical protein
MRSISYFANVKAIFKCFPCAPQLWLIDAEITFEQLSAPSDVFEFAWSVLQKAPPPYGELRILF